MTPNEHSELVELRKENAELREAVMLLAKHFVFGPRLFAGRCIDNPACFAAINEAGKGAHAAAIEEKPQ